MVLYADMDVKEILARKKKYPWPKLDQCVMCRSSKIWKHVLGTTRAYYIHHLLYMLTILRANSKGAASIVNMISSRRGDA